MKGVQCYELFGGIALKIHTFSFFIFHFQMTINPHKCSVMHIFYKRNTVCAKYIINGFPLNCVSRVMYLGVSISSNMSWSDHIDNICTKA